MLLVVISGLWEYSVFFAVVYVYVLSLYNAHMTFEITKVILMFLKMTLLTAKKKFQRLFLT